MRRLLTPMAVSLLALLPFGAAAEEGPLRLVAETTARREVVRLVFENDGDTRAELYVDARLASVELFGESGRRLGRCSSPRGAVRAGEDHRRFVTLEPGERTSEVLDLRYVCFGRRLRKLADAARARVTYRARLSRDSMGRPLVSAPLGPLDLELPRAAAPGAGASDGDDRRQTPLRLRQIGAPPDVPDGSRVPVRVELRAPLRARMPVVVRPELFVFMVARPHGEPLDCRLPQTKVRPLRDFFERLGRRRISIDLARLCPAGELDRAGVYEVSPSFSTLHDGQDVGLRAWTGTVDGEPFLVRVRRPSRLHGEPVEIEVPGVWRPTEEDGDAR